MRMGPTQLSVRGGPAAGKSLREVRIGVWWPLSIRRVTCLNRNLPLSRRTSWSAKV